MTVHTEQDLRDALRTDFESAPSSEQLVAAMRSRIRRQRRLAAVGTVTILAATGTGIGLTLTGGSPTRSGLAVTKTCIEVGCRAGPSRSVRQELHRPIHLPKLAPGDACPVTPGTPYIGPDVGGQRYGQGPVSLVIGDGGEPARGITHLGTPGPHGWLAAEDVLLVDGDYQGAVSIRARRLDGPGLPALGAHPGSSTYVLPAANDDPGSYPPNEDGSRTPPMTIWTKTPGCYGFQIDGQDFTETVVLDLTAPTGSG